MKLYFLCRWEFQIHDKVREESTRWRWTDPYWTGGWRRWLYLSEWYGQTYQCTYNEIFTTAWDHRWTRDILKYSQIKGTEHRVNWISFALRQKLSEHFCRKATELRLSQHTSTDRRHSILPQDDETVPSSEDKRNDRSHFVTLLCDNKYSAKWPWQWLIWRHWTKCHLNTQINVFLQSMWQFGRKLLTCNHTKYLGYVCHDKGPLFKGEMHLSFELKIQLHGQVDPIFWLLY